MAASYFPHMPFEEVVVGTPVFLVNGHCITGRLWMAFTFEDEQVVGGHDLGRDLGSLIHNHEHGINLTLVKPVFEIFKKLVFYIQSTKQGTKLSDTCIFLAQFNITNTL